MVFRKKSGAFHALFIQKVVLLNFQVLFMCFSLFRCAFHVLFPFQVCFSCAFHFSGVFHVRFRCFHEKHEKCKLRFRVITKYNMKDQTYVCIHTPNAPPNTHMHHQIQPKYKIYLVGLPSVVYEKPGQNERSVLIQPYLLLFRCFSWKVLLFTQKHHLSWKVQNALQGYHQV